MAQGRRTACAPSSTERGYHVTGVDLAPFILSGGGAYCMTLRLDRIAHRPSRHRAGQPRPKEVLT